MFTFLPFRSVRFHRRSVGGWQRVCPALPAPTRALAVPQLVPRVLSRLPRHSLCTGEAPARAASPLQLEAKFPAGLLCMAQRGSVLQPRGSVVYPLLARLRRLRLGCGASLVASCLALWWRASVLGKQSGWFPLGRLCLRGWLLGDCNSYWTPELVPSFPQRRRGVGSARPPWGLVQRSPMRTVCAEPPGANFAAACSRGFVKTGISGCLIVLHGLTTATDERAVEWQLGALAGNFFHP